MKKIISALALASLVLGVATADVKFSLNYRTIGVAFSRLVNSPNSADEDYNYWFQQDQGEAGASDTVSMTASTDYAGVTVRIDPSWAKGGSTLTLNQYSGYVKLGAFELGAGIFKDGKTQLNKRLSGGNGNYQGNTWETAKLGTWFKGGLTVYVDDMVNIAGGDNAASAYVQWKGNGPIQVMGSLIGLGGADKTWDVNGTIYTGFGLSVLGKFDPATVEFIFKTTDNTVGNRVLGLYVQPKLGGLQATVGGALAIVNDDVTEANVDLRLFQKVGNFSVAFDTNVSHLTAENDYAATASGGYTVKTKGNHVGARYLASDGTAYFVENDWQLKNSNGVTVNYNTVMWNMLGFNYTVTDWLSLKLSLGDVVSLHHMGRNGVHNLATGDYWRGAEVFIAPGLEINAGKNAFICTWARLGWSNVGVHEIDPDDATKTQLRESEFAVYVPLVLRVRF